MLAPEPSFVMYRLNALYAGMRFVGVPLRADFTLDADAMLAAIERERPALVWLAYPNNPTGNLFAAADIERDPARGAGARRRRRGVLRVRRTRASCRASLEFPNLVVAAHGVEDRHGRAAAGLRGRGTRNGSPELNKVRPPYNSTR